MLYAKMNRQVGPRTFLRRPFRYCDGEAKDEEASFLPEEPCVLAKGGLLGGYALHMLLVHDTEPGTKCWGSE